MRGGGRRLAVVLGVLSLPLAAFAIAVVLTPWSSWSARAYGVGVIAVVLGLVTATRVRRPGVTRTGLLILAATALVRVWSAASGATLSMTTISGGGPSVLGRVIDEGDAAIWGARIVFAAGWFRDPDVPLVPAALRDAYIEMRAHESDSPSPVIATYLGLQTRGHADVLVVDGVRAPRGAFVFLHGYGGSFALPCWQLAQVAALEGFVTYCPSVGPRGDWWSDDGERVVRDTMRLAAARGLDRVVLAGLSNGGVGAGRLAPRLGGALKGLVLIAGVPTPANSLGSFDPWIRLDSVHSVDSFQKNSPGVPVLVIQGRHDAMMSASRAKEYATRFSGKYVDLDAGHFSLLLRREEAARELRTWLAAR